MSLPPLHVVTDDDILRREGFTDGARRVMEAGGRSLAFHVRGPHTSTAALHGRAVELLTLARAAGCVLLVNDRVDLALALGLDGVHLGDRSLPVEVARAVLGPGWLGRSVHGPLAVREASAGGADYVVAGTVFATPSHPEREPGGAALVRRLADLTSLPLLAIGGVTPALVGDVVRAGAVGVAVRGGVWDAPEPGDAVTGYLEALAAAGVSRPDTTSW